MEDVFIGRSAAVQNVTPSHTEFLMFPFPGFSGPCYVVALPFLSLYVTTVILNGGVPHVIWWERSLHSAMFVLIAALLMVNVISTTIVMPKTIVTLLGEGRISLTECLTQLFFVHSATMLKSVVFVLMAFDRYVAICMPLRYHDLINRTSLLQLSMAGLARNTVFVALLLFLGSRAQYCKTAIIPHFVCEFVVLVSVACGDVSRVQMVGLMVRTGMTLMDVLIILVCYVKVLRAAWKIAVGSARHKALSTCGNHVMVALLVYSCGLLASFLHKVEESVSRDFQNLTSAIYFLLPSVANPIIYGLRVPEIRACLRKMWMKSP